MKSFLLTFCLAAWTAGECAGDDFLDRLDEKLTVTAFHDVIRARLSGRMDLEEYFFQQPPAGLIEAGGHTLFNPRLTLFVDAQLGPKVYFFVQSRVDRGLIPEMRGWRRVPMSTPFA